MRTTSHRSSSVRYKPPGAKVRVVVGVIGSTASNSFTGRKESPKGLCDDAVLGVPIRVCVLFVFPSCIVYVIWLSLSFALALSIPVSQSSSFNPTVSRSPLPCSFNNYVILSAFLRKLDSRSLFTLARCSKKWLGDCKMWARFAVLLLMLRFLALSHDLSPQEPQPRFHLPW